MAGVETLLARMLVDLVDHPEAARIQRTEREGAEVYRLVVHPDDLGKLIGKGGQTARALRSLLAAVSVRSGRRLSLEIEE